MSELQPRIFYGSPNSTCVTYSHEFVFDVVKTFSYKVSGLILSDRVRRVAGHLRIERFQLRFARQRVLKFANRRQKSGTVSLKLAVLSAQPELYGEPVALQQHNYWDCEKCTSIQTIVRYFT